MERIIVIGGKGTAINIAQHIVHARKEHSFPAEVLGFAIDDPALGSSIQGFPVLCRPSEILKKFDYPDVKVIYALYKPSCMRR